MKTYNKILMLALTASLFLGACGEGHADDSAITKDELQATCDGLTKDDPEGRIFKPVIGRYVKKKSHQSIVEDAGPTALSNVLTLENEGRELTLYSIVMTAEAFKEKYDPVLKRFFYDEENISKPENNIYGICSYQNASFQLMDKINTLTLIKGGE